MIEELKPIEFQKLFRDLLYLPSLRNLRDLHAFPYLPRYAFTFYRKSSWNRMGQTLKSCQGILKNFEFFTEIHWELWEFQLKAKDAGADRHQAWQISSQADSKTRPLPFKRSRMQNALVEDHQAHP